MHGGMTRLVLQASRRMQTEDALQARIASPGRTVAQATVRVPTVSVAPLDDN